MAFAPPRRPTSLTRASNHRRQDSDGTNRMTPNVRTYIENRQREWLSSNKKQSTSEESKMYDCCIEPYPHFQVVSSARSDSNIGYNEQLETRINDGDDDNQDSGNNSKLLRSTLINNAEYQCSKYVLKKEQVSDLQLKVEGKGESSDKVAKPTVPSNRAELRRAAEKAVNDAIAQQQRYGRVDRPDNHYCSVCKKLMTLPGHEPMCVIPCGHNICDQCSKGIAERCPVCSHNVQTTTHNVLLLNIIKQFAEQHGVGGSRSLTTFDKSKMNPIQSISKSAGLQSKLSDKKELTPTSTTRLKSAPRDNYSEELPGVTEYLPKRSDLEQWAEQLSAIEMRLSVMELQARETSTVVANAKSRHQATIKALKSLEAREEQMMENLKCIRAQLKEAEEDKVKIIQQIKLEKAEIDKNVEELNLINYTKAGLEGELDKLRLLCNRTH